MQATETVQTALHRYCATYPYTGSGVVGERLALMDFPDHICAAAEMVCEFADQAGCDPESMPAHGSVSIEHLAAFLGWQKVEGARLPLRELRSQAWTDGRVWVLPPQCVARAKAAGLFTKLPRLCPAFRRSPTALPVDPPPRAELFGSPCSRTPLVCVVDGVAYADPCHILSTEGQSVLPSGDAKWVAFDIFGVPAEIRSTDGDGLVLGVAVDSGRIMRFGWQDGCARFHLNLVSIRNQSSRAA